MSMIGNAVATNAGLKFAAGGLAAALALGGGAMATGNLACEIPGPDVQGNLMIGTGLAGSVDSEVETQTIEVEGLGTIDVEHSESAVEVLGVQVRDGASAEVRSQGDGSVAIDFILDGVLRTVLVSVTDGELLAGLAASTGADAAIGATVDGAIDTDAGGTLGILGDVDADGMIGIDGGADADGLLGIGGDAGANALFWVDGDASADSDLGASGAGDVGLLGGLGIDFDLDR